jgi:uncharacterized coiled-coil protein SlyX
MSNEVLMWIAGFCVTSGGALIATVWAMLNSKIDGQKREIDQVRERIADLYQKLEQQRQRTDGHHLDITKALYERTCRHE